ncbi:hypothetical protein PAXRUDRAFT_460361 [Paxillus rubicundulus Ve08.2h10]|uniref:Uncharacterized protein n=1 Tax=Paxillus rubicundulus Ve08.2h10 TaxID=930991 RepID=A0A0D0DAV5_9AGAM|nr:hypothetical protein PAXRUDRAFT_460361 [Paxillus rubicundulus Ve08.2h10]
MPSLSPSVSTLQSSSHPRARVLSSGKRSPSKPRSCPSTRRSCPFIHPIYVIYNSQVQGLTSELWLLRSHLS